MSEELALGFHDVRVAGPDEEVDRRDRLGAERERRQRLHAAEHVDLVGSGEMHRRDRRVGRPAAERRGARGDALDPGHLRGDDAHVGRRDHRVPAARHVRADVPDRNVPVAETHAGERLDVEIEHRFALRLSEPPHLRLAEGDVLEHLGRHPVEARVDLVRVEPEALRLPAVELRGVGPNSLVTPCSDGGDDLRHDLLDGGAGVRLSMRGGSGFQRLQAESLPIMTTYA